MAGPRSRPTATLPAGRNPSGNALGRSVAIWPWYAPAHSEYVAANDESAAGMRLRRGETEYPADLVGVIVHSQILLESKLHLTQPGLSDHTHLDAVENHSRVRLRWGTENFSF